MKEPEQRVLQQQTRENQQCAKPKVERQAAEQDTIDAIVVFMRVVLGNVLHENAAKIEQWHLAWIERTDEHAHHYPRSEIGNAQTRKNVWSKEQRQDETPASSQEIKERIGDEFLREIAQKRNFVRH